MVLTTQARAARKPHRPLWKRKWFWRLVMLFWTTRLDGGKPEMPLIRQPLRQPPTGSATWTLCTHCRLAEISRGRVDLGAWPDNLVQGLAAQ